MEDREAILEWLESDEGMHWCWHRGSTLRRQPYRNALFANLERGDFYHSAQCWCTVRTQGGKAWHWTPEYPSEFDNPRTLNAWHIDDELLAEVDGRLTP